MATSQPGPRATEPPPGGAPRAVDDERLTLAGLLFEVTSALQQVLTAQITEHDLTLSQFEVLLRLSRSPGGRLRMTDLADQVRLSTSGTTRLVDRLEQRGLVSRAPCSDDRRGLNALITPQGRALATTVLPGHLDLLDQWLVAPLESGHREPLVEALRALRDHVHPRAVAGGRDRPAADLSPG